MTVNEKVLIEPIFIDRNEIKDAINNNDPIEDKLNVIMVISNPCLYAKRYKLANEFIKKMENEINVKLFIVELAYKDQKFKITDSNNPFHLQLRTETPLWHKENMINIGVKKLLPENWKAFAWIDADIEFENNTWAVDTLKILNGAKDIVQLFSHAVDMDEMGSALTIFTSSGYQITKKNSYNGTGPNYLHPGFAWACTRKAYEKMGGLYELSILGSGDHNMLSSFINKGIYSIHKGSTENYKKTVIEFEKKIQNLRIGYTPGVIRHSYHGSKKNRKYVERWTGLIKYQYDPTIHVNYDKNGLLIPTSQFPEGLKEYILEYFKQRNEDE